MRCKLYHFLVVGSLFLVGCGHQIQKHQVDFIKDPHVADVKNVREWSVFYKGNNNHVSSHIVEIINNHELRKVRIAQVVRGAKAQVHVEESDLSRSFLDEYTKQSSKCAQRDSKGSCQWYYHIKCADWSYELKAMVAVKIEDKVVFKEHYAPTQQKTWCSTPGSGSDRILVSHFEVREQLVSQITNRLKKEILPFEVRQNAPYYMSLQVKGVSPAEQQLFSKGINFFFQKKYGDAIQVLQTLPEKYWDSSWTLNYDLGLLMEAENKKAEALPFYKKALQLIGPTEEETKERVIEQMILSRIKGIS